MTEASVQYAIALFGLAKEKKIEEKIEQDFKSLKKIINEDATSFFLHPAFSKEEKKSVVDQLQYERLLLDFLFVLIDNERFDLLDEILEAYHNLLIQQNNEMHVKVFSSKPLSDEQLSRIKEKLEKEYHRHIQFEPLVDLSLIAGYRLEFDGYELDTSVKTKLADLKQALKRN